MTMENQTFEDAFPIKIGIFHCHVNFCRCKKLYFPPLSLSCHTAWSEVSDVVEALTTILQCVRLATRTDPKMNKEGTDGHLVNSAEYCRMICFEYIYT